MSMYTNYRRQVPWGDMPLTCEHSSSSYKRLMIVISRYSPDADFGGHTVKTTSRIYQNAVWTIANETPWSHQSALDA